MRLKLTIAFLAMLIICATGLLGVAEPHKFIGATGCRQCHKGVAQGTQYEIWEASKHSKAFETLKSEAAAKIAKEKGLTVPASQAPDCLKCHTTGFAVDAVLLDAKFSKELGVQCEACHGAGFDYRGMVTMKNHEFSIQQGLNPIRAADGTAEKMCRTCHNEASPTFKSFDFSQAWGQIQHMRLKK